MILFNIYNSLGIWSSNSVFCILLGLKVRFMNMYLVASDIIILNDKHFIFFCTVLLKQYLGDFSVVHLSILVKDYDCAKETIYALNKYNLIIIETT